MFPKSTFFFFFYITIWEGALRGENMEKGEGPLKKILKPSVGHIQSGPIRLHYYQVNMLITAQGMNLRRKCCPALCFITTTHQMQRLQNMLIGPSILRLAKNNTDISFSTWVYKKSVMKFQRLDCLATIPHFRFSPNKTVNTTVHYLF